MGESYDVVVVGFGLAGAIAAIEAHDAGDRSDADEEDNVAECILEALGYPETVKVTAKVIRRESSEQ